MTETAAISSLTVETTIAAPPERVWMALTTQIGSWWPAEFYTGGSAASRTFRLEARPGGRMFEDWGTDQGLLWGTVVTARAPQQLQITGHGFAEWGGPNVMFATWNLEPDGDGTKVVFREDALGRLPEGYRDDKEKGWRFLFDGALKAFVEGRPAPKWEP